jgi:hypothetical protein
MPVSVGIGTTTGLTVKKTVFELTLPGLLTMTCTTPAVLGRLTVAISCASLEELGVYGVPLNNSVAPEAKPDPLTVSATEVPTVPDVGEMLLITGADASTVSVTALDVPPPGGGFVTCTCEGPPGVPSGIMNIKADALPNVPATGDPFNRTWEEGMNPVPLMLTDAPGSADDGLRPVIAGAGLVIVIVTALESCAGWDAPAGLRTITSADPVAAVSGMVPVNCVAEPAVVMVG